MQVGDFNERIPLEESLKNKIKKFTNEWILTSTSHGLPSVFRTDQFYLKVMWLAFFLGCTSGCIYIVYTYIQQFFEYNVDVSVAIVTELPSVFPAVTVCNLNAFYTPRAESFIVKQLVENNYTNLLNLKQLPNRLTALSLSKTTLTLLKTKLETDQNMTKTERENLGFTLSDMLITCTYNGVECGESNFKYLKSYEYTNCYTFNSGFDSNNTQTETQKIGSAGSGSSLELELYVGDESTELFIQNRGIYVVVHNQSISPLLNSEGIEISNGNEISLGVKRTFVTNLAGSYSSCIEDVTSSTAYSSTLYSAIFKILGQKRYRQKYCHRLCYQQMVINQCGCYDPSVANPYPSVNNTTTVPCGTVSLVGCMTSIKSYFQSIQLSTECENECPVECSFVYYDLVQSISSYPTDYYTKWLVLQSNVVSKFNNITASSFSNSLLKLNIFYASMDYTSITQSPALTWDVLLGNIGGMLGLLIGISALSLVELLELLFEIIRITWTHYKKSQPKVTWSIQ